MANVFGQSDTLNQVDEKGLKQGYWIIYGKDKPDKGYCDSCKIEEGVYQDNKKNGHWIRYHLDGRTPRLEGEYINNRPVGPYVKYYPSGIKLEEGDFSQGKLRGIYRRYYESGCLEQEKFFDNGREVGWVKYYRDDCRIEDSIQGTIDLKLFKDSLKPIVDKIEMESDCGDKKDSIVINSEGPSYEGGKKKDGKPLDPNGYNKIYNAEDELWMDGIFKSGRLWDGKLYKYDGDGILLKIEIWKCGRYHSDGDL